MCAFFSITILSPGTVCDRMATALDIVAVGMYSAASLPRSAAARSCSALIVGSSPSTSSPTAASCIARRMAGVGLVAVSERRSTMRMFGSELRLSVSERTS